MIKRAVSLDVMWGPVKTDWTLALMTVEVEVPRQCQLKQASKYWKCSWGTSVSPCLIRSSLVAALSICLSYHSSSLLMTSVSMAGERSSLVVSLRYQSTSVKTCACWVGGGWCGVGQRYSNEFPGAWFFLSLHQGNESWAQVLRCIERYAGTIFGLPIWFNNSHALTIPKQLWHWYITVTIITITHICLCDCPLLEVGNI